MLVYLAFATAAISFTISRSSMPVFEFVRMWVARKSPFLKELVHCPYCCSHWVAAAVCLVYRPLFVHSSVVPVDYLISWWALVGAAMVPVYLLLFIGRQ